MLKFATTYLDRKIVETGFRNYPILNAEVTWEVK